MVLNTQDQNSIILCFKISVKPEKVLKIEYVSQRNPIWDGSITPDAGRDMVASWGIQCFTQKF